MTAKGLFAFVLYIVHIWARWGRLTFRRYGARGVLSSSYRPQHAGLGYGRLIGRLGRDHTNWGDRGTRAMDLIARLRAERELVAA